MSLADDDSDNNADKDADSDAHNTLAFFNCF